MPTKTQITALVLLVAVVIALGLLFDYDESEVASDTTPPATDAIGLSDPLAKDLAIFPTWDTLEPATFPILVDGQASGLWYFEGSFPLEIRDPRGNILGRGYTVAQEEWMTENTVPFYAEIQRVDGAIPYSGQAELVLIRANPSDLVENSAEFTFPIVVDLR